MIISVYEIRVIRGRAYSNLKSPFSNLLFALLNVRFAHGAEVVAVDG